MAILLLNLADGSGEPLLRGKAEEVEPAPRTELGVDVAEVRLHGVLADPQLLGDAAVAQPPPDHAHDLDLAGGELASGLPQVALVAHQLLDHASRRPPLAPGLAGV